MVAPVVAARRVAVVPRIGRRGSVDLADAIDEVVVIDGVAARGDEADVPPIAGNRVTTNGVVAGVRENDAAVGAHPAAVGNRVPRNDVATGAG